MMEKAVVIGLVLALCILTDLAILTLAKLLPRYNRTDRKVSRWEAGNLPVGRAKGLLPMQYLSFMFLFMALEPITVVLFIFAAHPTIGFYILLLISLLLILPTVYIGYKAATEGFER
ncbi:MAG TPA: NADH-quinone oxidoreductase subunit A [Candidatus Syntrophoarchaeum butanivorans]|uniref:NADH-quinone oxidoreductase subunit A n=1 Tax=Candidatus Syntropharchaeum butanivorans TaxID=1839936 RepID=A0A7C0X4A7_9EURY|nr:NADH-quinone oxidoreductase subunit A [Candidatus Syntrophoarchaeum butanivorans]